MEPEKKSNGALIGLIVIIIVLVVGGIYIWMSNKKAVETMKAEQAQSEATMNQDSAALDALQKDVDGMDTNVDVDASQVN